MQHERWSGGDREMAYRIELPAGGGSLILAEDPGRCLLYGADAGGTAVYFIDTGIIGAFDDVVNISSATGTLNDIDGQVNIGFGSGAGTTLNVSDVNDTDTFPKLFGLIKGAQDIGTANSDIYDRQFYIRGLDF